MSNDLFLANNRLSASYSYANDEESIMRPCKRKTSKKRKDAQRISTKLAVLDPPNDYNKNICGYISKKIAKEYISVANKDLVETICSTFGS